MPARAWKHFYAEALKDHAQAKKIASKPGWRDDVADIRAEWVARTLKETPEETATQSMRYIEHRASYLSPGGYPTNKPEHDLWVRLGGKVVPFRSRA